ncbi:MAG: hypothetical protein VZQ55_02035 [Ruminococcus sp.]|nr:hypothetical protein [Ruminococcus sp.]
MILNVDKRKKWQLMRKVKKQKKKSSPLYYVNLYSLPVLILVSTLIIIGLYKSGYPAPITDTIVFFLIICTLVKFTIFLLNYKFSTVGISEYIGEQIQIEEDSISLTRHDLASASQYSVLYSKIAFSDIKKCTYDKKIEKITIYADYLTIDYIHNVPVNTGDCTELNIYDYFNPSLYKTLLKLNIKVEIIK